MAIKSYKDNLRVRTLTLDHQAGSELNHKIVKLILDTLFQDLKVGEQLILDSYDFSSFRPVIRYRLNTPEKDE